MSQRDTTIQNFNEEIKLKEKDNFDYESQDSDYQRRANVWAENEGAKVNNQISGFYTHYHQHPHSKIITNSIESLFIGA